MTNDIRKGPLKSLRKVVLLAAALSLVLVTEAMAAPKPEVKTNPLIVTASNYHSTAYTSDGEVWYWGGVADVILGKHTFRDNRPELMQDLKNAVEIQSYQYRELILKKDGTVWEWGPVYEQASTENNDGKTGFPVPEQIKGLPPIVKISASSISSAIDKDGSVWVWHPDRYFTGVHKLKNITDAKDISANGSGLLAILKKDGTVWEWEAYKETNANTDYTATQIKELKGVAALSSGHGTNYFAIKKDGTVWGWGKNPGGALGLPIATDFEESPVQIKSLKDVSSITTGYLRTLIIKKDGSLWVMGYDVADVSYDLKRGPELRRVKGLEKVTSVALGYNHAVAVTEDGKLWAWGGNAAGQLGDASFKDNSAPTPVRLPK
ncbi:RCC1 domain-containing protein [Cohnella terricola]|nr:hypothetical protein [Cohnella terricola]